MGLTAKIAVLPKDKDPNEVPAADVRKAYYQALPFNSSKLFKIIMSRR
ncbi:hypothetical protein JCM19235_1374 [Vibrio maritimus]|uniref:Uncharacterized protein n=1 Tax=Vibrio maritimus TaxID=990268 RepID=A0A090S8F7_9VIBR|nr:hypothetical protein JCM19235_1374 [Vibrio maritimus]